MVRTTISLDDALRKRLKVLAAERGISMAALIREFIELGAESTRPKPKSIGIGYSGYTDTARRAGEERPKPRPWR